MEECFVFELDCLKASYDSSEFNFFTSNSSPILKFDLRKNTSVTFEIPPSYPKSPPSISLSSTELTNSQRSVIENEIRELADKSLGYPMIMDLVTKLQQLVADKNKSSDADKTCTQANDNYIALILIDHMRQKKKYSNTLTSWASELNITGCLLFYGRWIFLLLQGSKKCVKDFIVRHRTVCIDVDSTGKPCKEKMSKIIFEDKSSKAISTFSIKDMETIEEMKTFFIELNLLSIFEDVIKPVLSNR